MKRSHVRNWEAILRAESAILIFSWSADMDSTGEGRQSRFTRGCWESTQRDLRDLSGGHAARRPARGWRSLEASATPARCSLSHCRRSELPRRGPRGRCRRSGRSQQARSLNSPETQTQGWGHRIQGAGCKTPCAAAASRHTVPPLVRRRARHGWADAAPQAPCTPKVPASQVEAGPADGQQGVPRVRSL